MIFVICRLWQLNICDLHHCLFIHVAVCYSHVVLQCKSVISDVKCCVMYRAAYRAT